MTKRRRSNSLVPTVAAAVCLGLAVVPLIRSADSQPGEMAPLPLVLPLPTIKGTPDNLPSGPGIEPLTDKGPELPKVAKGVVNVAKGKPVTSSISPLFGELAFVTDGQKEAYDEQCVEFRKGSQWVQVDLGQEVQIQAIAMWHDHRYIQVFHDVIVLVSNDPEFKTGVKTLFNNDTDNSSGLGVGTDREYFEREWGKVIVAKDVKARYIRGYTMGSNSSALNSWQEIEVFAVPAK